MGRPPRRAGGGGIRRPRSAHQRRPPRVQLAL